APSDTPALEPYWGKPAVRNLREDDGNVGIIRSPVRAIVPPDKKYSAGGNLDFRTSASIHDRVLFVDDRVWVSGQSIKDAANKKPTYIVELDEPSMRKIYEPIWTAGSKLI
ncbi:MAG: hypothetical protein ACLQDV_02215, partial [Candidatus Binataceae bacterium]